MRAAVITIACVVARVAAADPVVAIDAGHADVVLREDPDQLRERDDVASIRPTLMVRFQHIAGRVCAAPCNEPVPGSRMYVIDGPATTRSDPFELPAAGSVRVVVAPGSVRLHHLGRALELVGGLSLLFGGMVAGEGLVGRTPTVTEDVYIGLAIAGLPALVAGALIVARARTTVTIYDRGGTRVALDARRGALTF